METLMGIRGPDFVMLAADSSHAHSIMVLKDDETKIYKISDNLMMATIGEAGDRVQFTEYISKNILLYKMRNGYELGPKSAAHFTRKNLADYLRSRTPYQVNVLVGGYDEADGAQLHYIDYLANSLPVKYAAHGYGGLFVSSILDRYHHAKITQDEAYEILKKGVTEIQKRLIINLPNFKVSVIDKDGIKELADISADSLKQPIAA
ncbi:proteasome subunit beta type-2-like [Topomyia yanbarensis]|uniref:proteasome subunit beta type-2-like n=1 Tax=Topomyia yanbarensis TaxID=2498891 RepID=UPI00273B1719|nr:proteasome subunit beta type-2-like [Topomyia yanbarensis]XP_058815711.1 proteasome subunit beta type-2-like [Topomyia yanbarensis]